MKQSFTYRVLLKCGLSFSEGEYGDITFIGAFRRAVKGVFNAFLLKYCMYSALLAPLNYRKIRPILWRWMGVRVGKKAFIGYEVWMDYNNASLIEINDGAHITNRCLLLCHQRDLSNYYIGDDASKLPYKKGRIVIGKNVMVGMGTIIMPGVSIGEGSIIGAGSIVSKDIPAWKIATGRPARVVKSIPQK